MNTTDTAALTGDDLSKLQHMLGAKPGHHPKRVWGFRNRYATSGGEALVAMRRMESLGLVELRGVSNEMHYFQATEAGCRAAGLVGKQIKNALEE